MLQDNHKTHGTNWLSFSATVALWRTFKENYTSLASGARSRFWLRLGAGFLLAMAICAAVTLVGKWLGHHGLTEWDQRVLSWIVEEMPLFTFYNATIFESFGNMALTIPILVLTFTIASHRGAPLTAIAIILGYILLRPLIYFGWWIWDRARPEMVAEGIASPPFHSYPSGHATISIFMYGFLAWLWWRATRSRSERTIILALLAVLLFLVGWARLRLGTHWPSDIIAGFVIGGSWVGSVIWSINGSETDVLRQRK